MEVLCRTNLHEERRAMRRRLGVSSELPVEHVILFASLPLETMNLASNVACCCVAFEVEQCRMVRKRQQFCALSSRNQSPAVVVGAPRRLADAAACQSPAAAIGKRAAAAASSAAATATAAAAADERVVIIANATCCIEFGCGQVHDIPISSIPGEFPGGGRRKLLFWRTRVCVCICMCVCVCVCVCVCERIRVTRATSAQQMQH